MSQSSSVQPHKSFGMVDFLWRWSASLVLVFATYNPSGYSYVHWVSNSLSGDGLSAIHFLVAAILLAGWAIYLYATQNSLGTFGTVVVVALIGTCIWFLSDIGVVRADSSRAIIWLGLFTLATLLAVGLSWSHVWRRLSGQLEVDEVND